MHLMITKTNYKGKEKRYAKIVQSHRVNKISRPKILLNLGPINSESDEKRFRQILKSMQAGNTFVKLAGIRAKNAKEYGITYTTTKILQKYKIADILKKELSENNAEFDVYGTICALIINRLIEPSSDLSAYDWICNDYSTKLSVQQHHIYRALDHLINRKEQIEKGIFDTLKKKLKLNTKYVHYDLTSSYFEGSHCVIALFGHSRDHRKDRRQIVIALAMCDAIPIYHEVFKGNTVDKTTLKEMVNNLKKKLGIKKPIFVADRGLITDDNLTALEDEGYEYILGVERRNNNLSEELIIKQISSKKEQFAKEIHIKEIERNEKKYTRRYILCLNNETRKERLNTLKMIKMSVSENLSELGEKYKFSQKPSHRGRRMTRDGLMNKADKVVGKNKRIFKVWFDEGLQFSLRKDKYEYEEEIAGRFLLVTSTGINAEEIMRAYKQLQDVEKAFDEIKNFLDIRPIGHYKERRVEAHVFVCVLSFLVESIIERFSCESARKILRKLERIRIIDLSAGGNERRILTEVTGEMEEVFRGLGIRKPVV